MRSGDERQVLRERQKYVLKCKEVECKNVKRGEDFIASTW